MNESKSKYIKVKTTPASNVTSVTPNVSSSKKNESSISSIQKVDKKFLGTWRLEKSENFEEFLKELGE